MSASLTKGNSPIYFGIVLESVDITISIVLESIKRERERNLEWVVLGVFWRDISSLLKCMRVYEST